VTDGAGAEPVARGFRRLFEPLTIGTFTVRNRIVNTTHGTALGEARELRYLQERARGGVGLMGLHGIQGVSTYALGPGVAGAAPDWDQKPLSALSMQGVAHYDDVAIPHMKLRAEGLPVDEVESALPAVGVSLPSGSSLQGGTATAKLSIDGPLDRLVITGPVHVANSRLKGFDLGSKLGGLGALAGVRTGADTTIQTLASSVRVGPEGIRADGLTIVVPSLGTVTGAGTISPSNALNFKMNAKLTGGAGSMMGGVGLINTQAGSAANADVEAMHEACEEVMGVSHDEMHDQMHGAAGTPGNSSSTDSNGTNTLKSL